MSVCVTIRTREIPMSEDVVKYIAEGCDGLVVTSADYPSIHFGIRQQGIRGIEVNKEKEGLEVRICSLASKADYELFVKTILILSEHTHGTIVSEEDEEITDVKTFFDGEWIERQRMSGVGMACAMIRHTGSIITIYGLFTPITIGPKLLKELDISLANPFKEDIDVLEDYMCRLQWHLAHLKCAETIEIPDPKDESARPALTAVIGVKNGKVCDFDYLPPCDILTIIDFDGSCGTSGCPSMIPMQEAWKVLPQDVFRPLDETQYERIGELSLEMVNAMKSAAKRYQNGRLHWRPKFPGHGLDYGQDTYILMWNPDISSVSLEAHNESIPDMLTGYFNWSVWEHERAGIGDHFFLVRCGEGNTGIVMSGVFDSKPYQAEDWSGKGRTTYYVDMVPNIIINPDAAPMISTEDLQKAIPSFDWTGGHSGRLLTEEQASALEELWAKYLDENKEKADGFIMNYIDREKL